MVIDKKPILSIVIPTLDEAAHLNSTLIGIPKIPTIEIIVADGGSRDETCQLAAANGAKVFLSSKGRAVQMNTGAAQAQGELLLFLHADTKLPEGFMGPILQILSLPGVSAGAFQLKLHPPLPGLEIIERLANWRARVWQRPYGDQGLFLRKERFRATGGFPEMPIMEDVALTRRLRRQGRIVIASLPVVSSSRRWQEAGVLKITLRNQIALLGYGIGIPPDTLARWYHKKKKGSSEN